MARPLLPFLITCLVALAAPAAAGAAEPRTGEEALRLAKELRQGDGVGTGRELSPVLRSLAEKLPELDGADRRRAERLLARPTNAQEANPSEATYDVPEAAPFCGAHFCVHYVNTTTAGPRPATSAATPPTTGPT